eukprot:SAG31_NODE_3105_length_4668_cov_1.437733_8_plen_46_part_00
MCTAAVGTREDLQVQVIAATKFSIRLDHEWLDVTEIIPGTVPGQN